MNPFISVKFKVVEDKFSKRYWIIKTMFLLNKKVCSEKVGSFFDVKDGLIPFFNKKDAEHECKIIEKCENSSLIPFITKEYFIEGKMVNNTFFYSIFKIKYFLGFKIKLIEVKNFKTREKCVDYLNELNDGIRK